MRAEVSRTVSLTRTPTLTPTPTPSPTLQVLRALPVLEEALEPFRPRHHWGKCAQLTASPAWVASCYGERLRRFRALCDAHDPTGKFRNLHLNEMLFGNVKICDHRSVRVRVRIDRSR